MFQERRIISDETARFEELLVRQRDFFVEEELKEKYKRLISFVQQTETAMSSGETGELLVVLGGLKAQTQCVLRLTANSFVANLVRYRLWL